MLMTILILSDIMSFNIVVFFLFSLIIILIIVLIRQIIRQGKQEKANIGHYDQSLLVVKDLEKEDKERFFKNLKAWEMERDKYG